MEQTGIEPAFNEIPKRPNYGNSDKIRIFMKYIYAKNVK